MVGAFRVWAKRWFFVVASVLYLGWAARAIFALGRPDHLHRATVVAQIAVAAAVGGLALLSAVVISLRPILTIDGEGLSVANPLRRSYLVRWEDIISVEQSRWFGWLHLGVRPGDPESFSSQLPWGMRWWARWAGRRGRAVPILPLWLLAISPEVLEEEIRRRSPVEVAGFAPTPVSPVTVRPTHAVARVTIALLALSVLASAFGLALAVRDLAFVHGLRAEVRETAGTWNRLNLLGGYESGVFLGFIPIGICWLVWERRASVALHATGLPGLRFSPAWATGWWFIAPFNVVMPYLVMRELWVRSPPAGRHSRSARWREAVPAGWWLFFVATLPLLLLADWDSRAEPAVLRNRSVATAITFLLWHGVVMIAAALLAIALVYVIDRRLPSAGKQSSSRP